MSICGNCGNQLNNDDFLCHQRNNKIVKNEVINENDSKKIKRSRILAIISFLLSIVPIAIYIYCEIASGGSGNESEEGAVWWYFVIYWLFAGIPVMLVSLITGIISFILKKNILAPISLFIALLPFLILLFSSLLFW